MKFASKKLSEAMKNARIVKRKGYDCQRSLREVSKEIGVAWSTIFRVESQQRVDEKSVRKICKWLKVPLETFIFDIDATT